MSLKLYWRVHCEREILKKLAKEAADHIRSLTYDWMRIKGRIEKLDKRLDKKAKVSVVWDRNVKKVQLEIKSNG